jgi:murein DD-endopeptidase MepM/ murein hydrolase activator NlpD
VDNEQKNPQEQMADEIEQAQRSIARQAGKLAKKAGKKIGKIAMKALAKTLIVLAPYIAIGLLLLSVCVIGYYVVYEIRGSQQIYIFDKRAENETKVDVEKGYKKAVKNSSMTSEIQRFYKYMSEHSYWQIIGDDNTKLEQDTGITDYYGKEREYFLNSNFLFSLNETMFRNRFIYPEQFIKPVHYDPKTLTLKDLTNKKGEVIVESKEYDKNGDPTGKKIKSVADYGLGSIFKYKKAQKTLTVEGVAYQKDVFDESCECIKQVPINEPFKETLEGYPEDIYLMTKAITFVGEFEFQYKNEKTKYADLRDGIGAPNEDKVRVKYATYDYYRTEYYDVEVPDGKGGTKIEKRSRKVFVGRYDLYKYRKGAVYQTIPVLEKTIPHDKGQKYLRDYLYNFHAYLPESVMNEFDFEERVGSDYTETFNVNIALGQSSDSVKLQRSMQYFPIAEKYGNLFGVDPYLIIAIMAQESGGVPDVNHKGLMQIIGTGSRTIKAKDIHGSTHSFTITPAGRKNPDDAIRWATMYLKYLQDFFDGDPLKATLAYNMGEGTVNWIRKNYPQDWKTNAWMNHIPEANNAMINGNGDNLYLQHVLQYYVGNQLKSSVKTVDEGNKGVIDTIIDGVKGAIDAVKDTAQKVLDKVYTLLKKDYSKDKKFKSYTYHASVRDVDWALRRAAALEKVQLFSETDSEDLLFWESGYSDAIANANMKADDMINLIPDIKGFTPPLNIKNPVVTSPFGWRIHPIYGTKKFHKGIDLDLKTGDPVYAIGDGVVTVAVGDQKHSKVSYGNYVKINHGNGVESLYAHLDSVVVKQGEQVKRGQLIGYGGNSGGSTGSHLHFELIINGKNVDPYPVAVRPDAFKN